MQKNNKKTIKKIGEIVSLTNRQQIIFYFYFITKNDRIAYL